MAGQFNIFANFDPLATLIDVFHNQFRDKYDTQLCAGGEEPLYQPGTGQAPACITFTRDYLASALHEVAHWCIAGPKRRQMPDYGYWYCPDGRSAQEQAAFERVEIKPQALERIFAHACAHPFRISADNLHAGLGASRAFVDGVHRQTLVYCERGVPDRAEAFARALARAFGQTDPLDGRHYQREDLSP